MNQTIFVVTRNLYFYRGALSGKATLKWTDTNMNKWLKSPADFAPGKRLRNHCDSLLYKYSSFIKYVEKFVLLI